MKFRKLRIAWSVFWGLACVLVIVLWVRSYRWLDSTDMVPSHRITSFRGSLRWDTPFTFTEPPNADLDLRGSYSVPIDEMMVVMSERRGISIYFWIPTLAFATITAAPWLRWRFSLRTLLILTTLVAVVL